MSLPVSISPCPLVDAIVEIRFDTSVLPGAVFGIVYDTLKGMFHKATQLQMAAFPEEMRKSNPALLYQPHFRLESENLVALVGPNVFAVGMLGEYPKWATLSQRIRDALALMDKTGIIKTVHRFGLHYVNYFDRNILPDLELRFFIGEKEVTGETTMFKTVLAREGYKQQLQVFTDLKVTPISPTKKIDPNVLGSLIDIDCFQDYPTVGVDILPAINDFMESAHLGEKELFFSLLTEDFLKTLNPIFPDN